MPSQVIIETFESEILKNNPLGDPFVRKLAVYLPPGYQEDSSRRYPVIYLLSGFMGFGTMFLSPQAWGYAIDERCDKLIAEGRMEKCILVMPDCFTQWGGSQYMNSTAMGNYEDYLLKEIVPFVDGTYRTMASAGHRAAMGKSSGGYAALMLAMHYPDLFAAFFCSSGDMYFEYGYKGDFPKCYNTIRKAGSLENFFENFFGAPKKTGDMITAINIIAMAAAYSPNPKSKTYGFDLPFDIETGEIREDIWKKWLACDPVHLIDEKKFQTNLKKLKGVFLECGSRDEYHLHIGARIFTKKLKEYGIAHWYEEFDDGHMGTNYRYDVSLSKISGVISK
ncbi:esterase [bacterium]|nr:esterase [bacterium]